MTCKKDRSSHIVFHTMSALSAPAGHLSLEGKATIRESPLLKRRRATLVNPSAPLLRHPERSRGIFLALRLASHMSLQGNDALLLLFPASNIHRSSVCKEDFSTSLEMTIRQKRLVERRGVLATSKPISRLHTLPCHSVRRRQETGCPSPFLPPSPVRRGQACGPHRGSHS